MLSTTNSNSLRSCLSDLFLIALFLSIFYSLWIGGHALFTPDEGRYSEIAREMVVSGDYITPRLNGVAFLDKPVLYYWLQASAIRLFGLKEWALRFWPALAGVFGCLMVYFTGRQLFSRRTGILSAIILATSPLYYGAAHYANLDLEVAVLIGTTLLFSLLALQSSVRQQRSLYYFLAYIFCGLAALTKGLIGIAFPALIIGFWVLLLRRFHVLKQMHLLSGFIIFFAMTVPWYYLVQKANPEFLHFFFVTQQVARFLTHGDFNNRTVAWFYLPVVLAGFFPWSIFIIQAIFNPLKRVWKKRQEYSTELFLLIWLFLIFIFFSIPKSKTIGYIIPIFPTLALLVGHYLDQQWEAAKSKGFYASIYLLITLNLALSAIAFAAPYFPGWNLPIQTLPYLKWTGVLFLMTAILLIFFIYRKASGKFMVYIITSMAVMSLLTLSASASFINNKSIKPITTVIKPKLTREDEVVAYYKYYQDLPIYLERRITIVADWNAPDIIKKDNWLREMWFGLPFQKTHDWLINEKTFWQRWHTQHHLWVVMSEDRYADFLSKAKNSIRESGKYNDIIWVRN